MPHEIAGHSRRLHIGRLKGQQRQHMVHMPRHLGCPPRPPRPDRRRDVMDRPHRRLSRLHQRRHPQPEIRRVDRHQGHRLRRNHRLGHFADPALQVEILRQNLGDPHHRKLLHRKERPHPLGLHQGPGHARELHPRRQRLQPSHQRRPQTVARRLPGDKEDLHGSRAQRKSPAASASATIAGRSRQITPPASHTIPPRPAAATRRTVSTPKAGRSIRRSCDGLGAL